MSITNLFANLSNRARRVEAATPQAPKPEVVQPKTEEQKMAELAMSAVFYDDQRDLLVEVGRATADREHEIRSQEWEARNAEAVNAVLTFAEEKLAATHAALLAARQRNKVANDAVEKRQSSLAQLLKDIEMPTSREPIPQPEPVAMPVPEAEPVQSKPVQSKPIKLAPAPAPNVSCVTCLSPAHYGIPCPVCGTINEREVEPIQEVQPLAPM